MSARIKWTNRTFNFDFPAGIYPEVLERFRGAPARLEDHLALLPRELLTRRADNRWSMQENAGHLLDLEALVQQRVNEYLASRPELHAADMSNRKTYDAHHNDVEVKLILEAFRKSREQTVAQLLNLDSEVWARSALHPRLNKQMRLVDMLYFQAEHDDYHLARISELKQEFSKTDSLEPT